MKNITRIICATLLLSTISSEKGEATSNVSNLFKGVSSAALRAAGNMIGGYAPTAGMGMQGMGMQGMGMQGMGMQGMGMQGMGMQGMPNQQMMNPMMPPMGYGGYPQMPPMVNQPMGYGGYPQMPQPMGYGTYPQMPPIMNQQMMNNNPYGGGYPHYGY